MPPRIRPRMTVTVDPDMLEEIDSYVAEHRDTDRSQVVDEALRLWYAKLLRDALIRQHSSPKTAEELEEKAVWKRIRSVQLKRLGSKFSRDSR